MFQDLSSPDTAILLSYLLAAFFLGSFFTWLFLKKRFSLQNESPEILKLKRDHQGLKKDYLTALKAIDSLKEQAENMQQELHGNLVLPKSASKEEVSIARKKLKLYVESRMLINRADLGLAQMDETQSIQFKKSPIDYMDAELVLILGSLLKS